MTKFSKQNHMLKFITTIRGGKNLKEILCNRYWCVEIQFYEQFCLKDNKKMPLNLRKWEKEKQGEQHQITKTFLLSRFCEILHQILLGNKNFFWFKKKMSSEFDAKYLFVS